MLPPLCYVTPTLKLKSPLDSDPAALDARMPVNNFLFNKSWGLVCFTFTITKQKHNFHGPGWKNKAASTSSLALMCVFFLKHTKQSNVLAVIILKCSDVGDYFKSFLFSMTSGCFSVLDARHTVLLCHASRKWMQRENRKESAAENMFKNLKILGKHTADNANMAKKIVQTRRKVLWFNFEISFLFFCRDLCSLYCGDIYPCVWSKDS